MIKKDPEAEQRLILAVFLSVAVYWIWTAFFLPPPPPVVADPVAQAAAEVTGQAPTTSPAAALTPEPGAAPVVPAAADLPERTLAFSTSGLSTELTSEGGGLADVVVEGHQSPFEIQAIWSRALAKVTGKADDEWLPWGLEPGPERLISAEGLVLAAGAGGDFIVGRHTVQSGSAATATYTNPQGIEVRRTYTPTDDPNLVHVDVTWTHRGSEPWKGPLWVGAADRFEGEANRYSNVARPVISADGDLETLEDLEDLERLEGPVGWFGIADRYFIAAAIPQASWGRGEFAETFDGRQGAFLVHDANLMPGQSDSVALELFIGPKELEALGAHHPNLEAAVDFGIFGFFSRILLWILQGFHGLVGNWGAAIILLTLSVKIGFWPLTQKSFASGRKMQALQPKIQAMKEKFPDDPQRQGQEQMKLFQEEGVNPLGGCIPMIIQMPVWFALYSVLLFSVDVYHAEFFYLRDLSSPDPWGVLPTLVGVLMVLQQRLTPMSPSMDPTQQKIMRMMPLVFVFIMYSFPSGLALYILVNTILSILQMWLVNKAYPMVTPPAAPAASKA